MKGMPQTVGIVSRRNAISDIDSTVVARIRAAGAIPLGVTNVSVSLMHWETDNKLYGRTNNPYDLSCTPAGSSGGEGAIIGAAGSLFGMGSDIGGSIRLPAAFCGIFGHKPSPILVPGTGSMPLMDVPIESLMLGSIYAVCGPLARYSEDLMPILKIIAGPDGIDPRNFDTPVGNLEDVDVSSLTYYYIDHQGLHADVQKAMEITLQNLKNTGTKVKKLDVGKFAKATDIFFASLRKAVPSASIGTLLGGGGEFDVNAELEKEKTGSSDFPLYILNIIKNQRAIPEPEQLNLIALGEEFRQEFSELLGDNGVFIYPTFPDPAIKHGEALLAPEKIAYTGIFNILGCAVTSFPMGLSQEGRPYGMQVIAKAGNDHKTIAVANHMEKLGYGWIPPQIAGLE